MECVYGLLLVLCGIGIALAILGIASFGGGMAGELQTIDLPWPDLDLESWLKRCRKAGRRLGRWVVRRVCG